MIPTEAYELSIWAKRIGAEDPLPYLLDMSLIDTTTIRSVGRATWGLKPGDSKFTIELAMHAQNTWNKLLEDLGAEWRDRYPYEAFKAHMDKVRYAMDDEEAKDRFPTVGQVLVDIADTFEVAWYEVLSWVVTALGLIIAVVGFAFAIYTAVTGVGGVAGVIVGLIGLIITAVGAILTYWNSVKPRLEALASATSSIDGLNIDHSKVDDLQVPDASDGWDATREWKPE